MPRSDMAKSQMAEPKKTVEANLDDHRRFWVKTIGEFLENGTITSEHLRRSPRLARVIKSFLEK
jgi:hypothetical protein